MDSTATHTEEFFNAARRGDVPALQAALATGLPIDTPNPKGFSALILASYDDHLDATRFLLDAGANPNHQDNTGSSALMGVSFKGYPETARLLLARGANPNLQSGNGGTALMFAVMFGRNELIKVLLDGGADQTIQDARGFTALHLAGQQGNATAWELLGGEAQKK